VGARGRWGSVEELQLELPSRGFFSQTTSLEFLTKHRFDWNECIYDGVLYLSHEQEAAARVLVGLVPWKAALPSGAQAGVSRRDCQLSSRVVPAEAGREVNETKQLVGSAVEDLKGKASGKAEEEKAAEVAPKGLEALIAEDEAAEGAPGVKETEGPSALGEEAAAIVDERDLPVAAGVEEAVVEPEASSVSGEKVRAASEEEASDVIDEEGQPEGEGHAFDARDANGKTVGEESKKPRRQPKPVIARPYPKTNGYTGYFTCALQETLAEEGATSEAEALFAEDVTKEEFAAFYKSLTND
jgi:hypothetical protein